MKYKNWLIIGAGSIGALKPNELDSPTTENILTHAHALHRLRGRREIDDFFIVDVDEEKAGEACVRWNTSPCCDYDANDNRKH